MSQAKALSAPRRRAAMDRMPLPQPRSRTRSPPWMWVSSACRHRRVVAWLPVPKVRPGSKIRGTLPAYLACPFTFSCSHSGITSRRSPISMGL